MIQVNHEISIKKYEFNENNVCRCNFVAMIQKSNIKKQNFPSRYFIEDIGIIIQTYRIWDMTPYQVQYYIMKVA